MTERVEWEKRWDGHGGIDGDKDEADGEGQGPTRMCRSQW